MLPPATEVAGFRTVNTMNRCAGIVLSVLAFRESDLIVTVFSPEGLVKFFVKHKRLPLMTVLTEGEFVYVAGQGDMCQFRDGTILQQHLKLRERLESLEAAGKLAQAILKSQLPGKEAPRLYQLFCYFLRMIPEVERPEDLAALFQIKMMKHEGFFQQMNRCSVCKEKANFRYGGERFCHEHTPKGALKIALEEEKQLIELAEGRSLKKLLAKPIVLHRQISILFNQIFN